MNTKYLYFIAAAVVLMAAGCRTTPLPVLNVSPSSLSFAAAGESKTFEVKSNASWNISKPAWLTVSSSSGNGIATITVEANANMDGKDRSGEITVAASDVNATVSVSQKSMPLTSISIRAIGGVAVPVTGMAPVSNITATEQFTGTVAWSPLVSGVFANNTEYTAIITLTPQPGYTLTGVTANFFSVEKATSNYTAGSDVVTARFPATAATAPNGTPQAPFLVASESDLRKIGKDLAWTLDKHYRQIANITLTENWTAIGGNSSVFNGSYDGDGYTIANLNIPSSTNPFNEGLFAQIGGAVRNLALKNVNINSTSDRTGAIAGTNGGIIENCYVSGNQIRGTSYVGGVVGLNGERKIQNCYTTCDVTGSEYIGGIAGFSSGEMWESEIFYCYAAGKISGENYVGGIVGLEDEGAIVYVKGCVALNPEVSASAGISVGRIANYSTIYFFSNFARSDMTLTGNNGAVTPAPITTGRDGENATADRTHGESSGEWWRSWPNFPANFWNFAANRLPHLKTTTGEAFVETQDPTVVN